MFGTFRKHSTWLWSIIIAAVAISMVIYFGPGNQSATDSFAGRTDLGTVGGEPVTQDALNDAVAEARIQYFIARGEWPGSDAERQGFDLMLEAYKRLFVVQQQEKLGIHVGSDQVAKVAANELRAMSKNGKVTMAMFEANVLKPAKLTLGDYQRFLRHQLGVEQLVTAVATGGRLVTEKEARAVFERENRERSVQAVFFSLSNHLAGVTSTPEALTEFYSNRLAQYRLPDRIQVSYVEFKATNHWADVGADMDAMTNSAAVAAAVRKYSLQPAMASLADLDALLNALYTARGGTNFYTDMSPEKARESIRSELHDQLALRLASRRANEFADPIMSATTLRVEALAERAREQGLTVQVTAPFDRESPPEGLEVSEQFVNAAFALRVDEPIAGPLATRNAVYMIARHKEIPSELQSYEQVKDKVASDYRLSEALNAARSAADGFVAKATNAVAEGKTFASVCSEAKVAPLMLPPLSRSTRSLPEVEAQMSLQQFKQIAFGFPVGQVSPSVPIMEGSVVAYIQSEPPLDEQKVTAELPGFVQMFRQARQQEAFEEWFNHEASRALANTPVMQRPPEINQPGAAN